MMILITWLVGFALLIVGIIAVNMGRNTGIVLIVGGAAMAFFAINLKDISDKLDKLTNKLGIGDEPE